MGSNICCIMLTLYCSQGLKVMGLRSKIGFYVRGEGLGSHKLSWCKCLLGCTYKGQKLTKTILQGWSTLSEGSSWGLSRQLFSLSFIDLMPIKEHRITMSEDKYTRHKHTHMCTQTQIKKDNSKCLFWVYERGGQTRSSRSLSGHRVPSQHERSPVLGGWTETERGFFVLCNYAIVFPL